MRYLMIDRVTEWEPFKRVVALKNVSLESDVLEHHFPGFPLFPGVLTLEAMAQASGYLIMRSILERDGVHHASALTMVERVHFRRPVFPGDQLQVTVEVTDWQAQAVRVTAHAEVEHTATARGRLLLAHRPIDADAGAETLRYAERWLRSLERPAGLA